MSTLSTINDKSDIDSKNNFRWFIMIEMSEVYKTYPNGVLAVNGIDIMINQGEFVYVVGPSGAGKSTFIKMMYREEKPSSGKIIINGMDLSKLKENKVPLLRRNIGVVFQDFKLLPKLTVFENVAFALEVIGENPKILKESTRCTRFSSIETQSEIFPK